MKTFLIAGVAALALTTAAGATTFNVDVEAFPANLNPPSNGLKTRAHILSGGGPQQFTGSTITFDLVNLGDSVSVDLYKLVHFKDEFVATDLNPLPSSATFDFGPLGAYGGLATVSGTSAAQGTGMTSDPATLPALATFDSTSIRVSATEQVLISIADTFFGPEAGGASGGVVTATFTLAAIPLPAGLPLALLGLGMLGAVAARRKQTAAAA